MTFIRWSSRVLKKGFWVLGLVPQLLDYISTYVPSQNIPAAIRNLLEKGGNWRLTLILVSIGLLVSAFLVHLETQQALDERDLRVRQLMEHTEESRRRVILTKLRQKYILSHDGISPDMMAGLEPLPREWVERELKALGETWRQDQYY